MAGRSTSEAGNRNVGRLALFGWVMGSFQRRGGRVPFALALALTAALAAAVLMSSRVEAAQDQRPQPFTLTLQGSSGPNEIFIWYSVASGRYVITANGFLPRPVGDDGEPVSACVNPGGKRDRLSCASRAIGGFEVNAGGGNDSVVVLGRVRVSTMLVGGPGNDDLAGGRNTDRLIGGYGNDKLAGRDGADYLFGGPQRDFLYGGRGLDVLIGGPGFDRLRGGPGRDVERQGRPRRSGPRRGRGVVRTAAVQQPASHE